VLLKSQRINTSFLDYLFASSFTTISDLATKGYSSLNDDKYKKIISECKITSYTDEPTEDVKEYYTRFAGKRTKREL
jgi:hypothetical protein